MENRESSNLKAKFLVYVKRYMMYQYLTLLK